MLDVQQVADDIRHAWEVSSSKALYTAVPESDLEQEFSRIAFLEELAVATGREWFPQHEDIEHSILVLDGDGDVRMLMDHLTLECRTNNPAAAHRHIEALMYAPVDVPDTIEDLS